MLWVLTGWYAINKLLLSDVKADVRGEYWNKWGNSVTKADEEIRNFMTKGDE